MDLKFLQRPCRINCRNFKSTTLVGNQGVIYDALLKAGKPMTAYQLIDAVRPAARLAPPTVYRALGQLIEDGLAHRLESVNAFVPCRMAHRPLGGTVSMLCRDCGTVEALVDEPLSELLRRCAAERRFQIDKVTVELRGLCAACLSPKEVRA